MVYTLLKQALYFPANKHFLNFDDELFNMEALRTEKRKLKVKIVCYPVFITGITYKLVWGGGVFNQEKLLNVCVKFFLRLIFL